jgi:thiaminase
MISKKTAASKRAPLPRAADFTKSFLKDWERLSRSYDAMVAHVTLVCCRYIILEIGKRTTTDPRTLGTLFYATCDEMRQSSFTEALAILLKLLEQALERVFGFSKDQIECFVQQFIEQLPPVFRGRLLLLATANGKN